MIGVLEGVLHGVLDIPYLVIGLLVQSLNGWILAIAVLARGLVAVLPGFPSIPTVPSGMSGALAWVVPMAPILVLFSSLVGIWVTWTAYKVALNWVKVHP